MTKVINLFGGPGSGKSTLAAGIFAELKRKGQDVELVTEYVKGWAWEGKNVGTYDQLYLLGKQTHYESRLYGKVEYIVTDSPIALCPFYEVHNEGTKVTLIAAKEYLKLARANDVQHINFWLPSMRPYDPKGRYQTADEAKAMEGKLIKFLGGEMDLDFYGIPFDGDAVEYVLGVINNDQKTDLVI